MTEAFCNRQTDLFKPSEKGCLVLTRGTSGSLKQPKTKQRNGKTPTTPEPSMSVFFLVFVGCLVLGNLCGLSWLLKVFVDLCM